MNETELPFSVRRGATRAAYLPYEMAFPRSYVVAMDHSPRALLRLLDEARDLGAQCIVVTCPQCQLSLGASQGTIEARYGVKYGIPVLYFTQLLGLALGISSRALGLSGGWLSARALPTL